MPSKYSLAHGQSRENWFLVFAQIADFRLKYCILKQKSKNTRKEVSGLRANPPSLGSLTEYTFSPR